MGFELFLFILTVDQQQQQQQNATVHRQIGGKHNFVDHLSKIQVIDSAGGTK